MDSRRLVEVSLTSTRNRNSGIVRRVVQGLQTCVEIKFYGAFALNRRVDPHAIFMISARWRGDAGSSPLDGASTAAHPTHWLISTQPPNK